MSARRKRFKKRQEKHNMKQVLERSTHILDIILDDEYETLEDMITAVTGFRNECKRFIKTL